MQHCPWSPPARPMKRAFRASAEDHDLIRLLESFPPVRFAFAYGSGVFRQRGYSDEQARSAMTDLVLAVDDPVAWHRENIALHGDHYSALAWLGAPAVARLPHVVGRRRRGDGDDRGRRGGG